VKKLFSFSFLNIPKIIVVYMFWQTSKRTLSFEGPLVMGILNVTPDSFSDLGQYVGGDAALKRAEQLVAEGADIIDIGGESTRPGSTPVSADEETGRVVHVIESIATRFDIPISIDTTKSVVAMRAIDAGAEIINDVSGLRFDDRIADVAARAGAGLILMHSRGSFETMHRQALVDDILKEVGNDFRRAIDAAKAHGVEETQIALDVGIGFSKTQEQNLELIENLDKLAEEFAQYPFVIGTSRKSFLTRIAGNVPPTERLEGSLITALIAVRNGAKIVRVHDVKETVAALKVAVKVDIGV
jgi:dihydropteroate synthase